MKHFYAVWYNYIAQQNQVEFIVAENEEEVKKTMVLIMRFFGGDSYDEDDIETIDEICDSYFVSRDEILSKYKALSKIPKEY